MLMAIYTGCPKDIVARVLSDINITTYIFKRYLFLCMPSEVYENLAYYVIRRIESSFHKGHELT